MFELVVANAPALLWRADANGFQSPIDRRRKITVYRLRVDNRSRFIEQFVGDISPQMHVLASRARELAPLRGVRQEDQGLNVGCATLLYG